MTIVHNRCGMRQIWFEKAGPRRRYFGVLAVRGTFDFNRDGQPVTLAEEQLPFAYGDEFDGPAQDPMRCVVRTAGDLVIGKPGTDVQMTGTARPEDGRAVRTWYAGLAVGPVRKVLRLQGPRHFHSSWLGWRQDDPQATDAVSLDYRLAYGGTFDAPGQETGQASKPDNPAGCGWLPDAASLRALSRPARRELLAALMRLTTLDAPQIDDPVHPVTSPNCRRRAEGFGPIARWWMPRAALQGTLDSRWIENECPALPADFDPRFLQHAHPDLVCRNHLAGDERVVLAGVLPEGTARMRLPGWQPIAVVVRNSGARIVSLPVLDTVSIDLDRRQVSLVWRTSFDPEDKVREVVLGVTSRASLRPAPAFQAPARAPLPVSVPA